MSCSVSLFDRHLLGQAFEDFTNQVFGPRDTWILVDPTIVKTETKLCLKIMKSKDMQGYVGTIFTNATIHNVVAQEIYHKKRPVMIILLTNTKTTS